MLTVYKLVLLVVACLTLAPSSHGGVERQKVLLRLNLFAKGAEINDLLIDSELNAGQAPGRKVISLRANSKAELSEKLQNLGEELSAGSVITHLFIGAHGASGALAADGIADEFFTLWIGQDDVIVGPKYEAELKYVLAPISPFLDENLRVHLMSCEIFRGARLAVQGKTVAFFDALGVRKLTVFGHIHNAHGLAISYPYIYSWSHIDRVLKGSLTLFDLLKWAAALYGLKVAIQRPVADFQSLRSGVKILIATVGASLTGFLGMSLLSARQELDKRMQMGHEVTIIDRRIESYRTLDAFDHFHYAFLNS